MVTHKLFYIFCFLRVYIPAKIPSLLYHVRLPLSVCLSVHVYQQGHHWADFGEISYLVFSRKSVEKTQLWVKLGKNFGQFTWRIKYVLFLPSTLQRHKSAVLYNYGFRLSGSTRNYSHYAKMTWCYVVVYCLHCLHCLHSSWFVWHGFAEATPLLVE